MLAGAVCYDRKSSQLLKSLGILDSADISDLSHKRQYRDRPNTGNIEQFSGVWDLPQQISYFFHDSIHS